MNEEIGNLSFVLRYGNGNFPCDPIWYIASPNEWVFEQQEALFNPLAGRLLSSLAET